MIMVSGWGCIPCITTATALLRVLYEAKNYTGQTMLLGINHGVLFILFCSPKHVLLDFRWGPWASDVAGYPVTDFQCGLVSEIGGQQGGTSGPSAPQLRFAHRAPTLFGWTLEPGVV